MTLRESIEAGDSGHIGDHEVLHARHNRYLLAPVQGFAASTPRPVESDYTTPLTGDLDIRAKALLDDAGGTSVEAASMGDFDNGQSGTGWGFLTGFFPVFWCYQSGALVYVESTNYDPDILIGAPMWQRVTVDLDNGSGGYTVTFYYSDDDGATWTLLSEIVTSEGTLSIDATTFPLCVGGDAVAQDGSWPEMTRQAGGWPAGLVLKVEVRSGIGGTVIASPDFTGAPWTLGDSGPHDDAQSNEWECKYGQGATETRPRTWGSDIMVARVVGDITDPADLPAAQRFFPVSPRAAGLAERVAAYGSFDLSDATGDVRALNPATIPELPAVPESFADLAAVQSYLAELVASEGDGLAGLTAYVETLSNFLIQALVQLLNSGLFDGRTYDIEE